METISARIGMDGGEQLERSLSFWEEEKKKWMDNEGVSSALSSARLFRIQNRDVKSYGRR